VKYRWTIAPPEPLRAGQLARDLNLSPLLVQCLFNRGLQEPAHIHQYLEPRLRHLADPFELPDMAAAVDRLLEARQRGEPVVIFGDYDVDGVTSTALLLEVLEGLGWKTHHYLPNRKEEGYGLSREATENCLRQYPSRLLLAVDCGSASADTINLLRRQSVDVIVLDHHQVSPLAPPALALVNPLQGGRETRVEGRESGPGARSTLDSRPSTRFSELCSAGLAFKLAHALIKRGRETQLPGAADFDLRPLLDLVALGTIADIVPLTGENRILVSAGLARLNSTPRPGLIALKEVAQVASPLGTYEVGFQLGPRLNAAGRLESAEAALNLLRSRDPGEATSLARGLDGQNRERQNIERGILEDVLKAVRARFNPNEDFVIVEGQDLWHLGVVGIVASRVLQEFYRPTIILGGDGNVWRGSGRSIAGFDLAAALGECDDLLERHGGHALAAGVSLPTGNVDAFRTRLNELARRTLSPESLQPPLNLDAETDLDAFSVESVGELDRVRPTGPGNPPVQCCVRNLAHRRPLQRIGSERRHVKMWVTNGCQTLEAVWWGAGDRPLPVGRFDLAFTPQINRFNGRQAVQLKVLDWRKAG
jgi:single-stranded-DNA-specific exonuclease